MKKIISLIFAILICLSASAVGSAISLGSGTDALEAQFLDGFCPNGIDYAYYSPVKTYQTVDIDPETEIIGNNDNNDNNAVEPVKDETKYPLFIWIHGLKSGTEKRQQIKHYGLYNYASDEYQAKFASGGCFIFAPRESRSAANNWGAANIIDLKSAIDYFISVNIDNIDTSRIYICGSCTGGNMVWNMATAYPDFFAAILPASALSHPGTGTIRALKNTGIWTFSCARDPYPTAMSIFSEIDFISMKAYATDKTRVRKTTFSQAVYPDGNKKNNNVGGVAVNTWDCEHYTWPAIFSNMHMKDGSVYKYTKTVDGTGRTIDFSDGSGVIEWLNEQTNIEGGTSTGGTSTGVFDGIIDAIIDGFVGIINMIEKIFE